MYEQFCSIMQNQIWETNISHYYWQLVDHVFDIEIGDNRARVKSQIQMD